MAEHKPIGSARWEDLVLPEQEKQSLAAMIAQLRRRATVEVGSDFSHKRRRSPGIVALFLGPDGNTMTLAAEVVANELGLDVHRVDLSAVADKYLGNAEEDLRRLFGAAEARGDILLFGEASALFGKRSEVKGNHDRYANIAASYLLQRLQTHGGLTIFTTKYKESLGGAFLRRPRYVVRFP